MTNLANQNQWYTPALLGIFWGLIPCGFLYVAQIKAAQTGNLWLGAATMLAFGLGTIPTMLGVGILTSKLSSDERSQLFQVGGWITLAIGILTLMRTEEHIDYIGHGALLCLILALIARPISRIWSSLLYYRRVWGVLGFCLCLAHTIQMIQHTFKGNLTALLFMLPQHQLGIIAGIIALTLMIPLVLTSSDRWQNSLGTIWRKIHLLVVPAFILAVIHTVLVGSHYLGGFQLTVSNKIFTIFLGFITVGVLLFRLRFVWLILSLEDFYAAPIKSK